MPSIRQLLVGAICGEPPVVQLPPSAPANGHTNDEKRDSDGHEEGDAAGTVDPLLMTPKNSPEEDPHLHRAQAVHSTTTDESNSEDALTGGAKRRLAKAPKKRKVGAKQHQSQQEHQRRPTSTRDKAPSRHFKRIPQFLPSLEFFFFFGVMVLVDTTLAAVVLPLKIFLQPRNFSKRDVISCTLIAAGLAGFLIPPTESMLYSYFYHFIRASSMLKLYVIFNMLEVAEKLLTSLVSDACEALGLALQQQQEDKQCNEINSSEDETKSSTKAGRKANESEAHSSYLFSFAMWLVAAIGVSIHSLVLLLHVITINVAINSQGNSLFALLVSNNFLEVKSVVFKRFTAESLFQVAMGDAVERFQYVVFVVVMLGQHAQSEGFGTVEPLEVLLIFGCEVCIDFFKHLYVSRFNQLHLGVYDYFSHMLMFDVAREKYLCAVSVPILTSTQAATTLNKTGVLRQPYPMPFVQGSSTLQVVGTTSDVTTKNSSAFVPQPARRAAFVPFAYVALLIWQFSPMLWRFARHDHLSFALFICCLVAGKVLCSTLVGGVSLRFACRSMLLDERRVLAEVGLQSKSAKGSAEPSPQQRVDSCGGVASGKVLGSTNSLNTSLKPGGSGSNSAHHSHHSTPHAPHGQQSKDPFKAWHQQKPQRVGEESPPLLSVTDATKGGSSSAHTSKEKNGSLVLPAPVVTDTNTGKHHGGASSGNPLGLGNDSFQEGKDGMPLSGSFSIEPRPSSAAVFGVSPVGMGVSVPVATPPILARRADRKLTARPSALLPMQSLEDQPPSARSEKVAASGHTPSSSFVGTPDEQEQSSKKPPVLHSGAQSPVLPPRHQSVVLPPALSANNSANGKGEDAASCNGSANANANGMQLCVVLDNIQAALFCVDRFDNRAGKTK